MIHTKHIRRKRRRVYKTSNFTYLVSLIAEEVYFLKFLVTKPLKAVRLVPATRENVERDLTAYGVGESVIWELFPQDIYELFAEFMLLK